MSNYNNLKTSIDANIKQNGNQEITGPILNSVLNQMVNILGTGYQFAGVANLDPATDPGTPDAKVFYIANGKGTYEKFGGLEVTEDDVVVLYWDTAWHKVATGIASQSKLSELNTQINGGGGDIVLAENIVPEPSWSITRDMVNVGDTIHFILSSVDGARGVLRADKTGYVFDSWLIVDAGATDVAIDYVVGEDFLRIYWTSQYAAPLINKAFISGTRTGGIVDDIETLQKQMATKQATLVSGSNIKTINNQSILGSGNINVDVWHNKHNGILDKLPLLKSKLMANEDDINILMLGDSFFALQESASILTNIANLPPMCNRNHTQYQIWNRLVKNKPQCDRWDSSVNAFIESNGTFVSNGATFPTMWDSGASSFNYKFNGKKTGIDLTRYSADSGARVDFTWNMASYEKLNFIYSKSGNLEGTINTKGTSVATIAIAQGNGKAQVWNGSAWVEANGFTFSEELTSNADGYAVVVMGCKLKFKRVTTDTINVSVINTANDGLLYYWGTERWNGNTIFITNIARGGFAGLPLQLNLINDIGLRDCDLVLYEPPFTNDMGSYTEVSCLNACRWTLEGKSADGTAQSGWIMNSCLKTLSSNWTKFEVLGVIPHIGSRFINTDDTFKIKAGNSVNYYNLLQRYKNMFRLADVPFVGIDAVFIAQARAEGLSIYDSVKNNAGNYTTDDVHPNDKGCYLYAREIEPIFELF